MQPGDELRIEVYKADGRIFRRWPASVEQVEPDRVVTWSPVGHVVRGRERDWVAPWAIRAVYWHDRPYNLLEVYRAGGELFELYVHVGSRPFLHDLVLSWTDYELDVILKPGGQPKLVDEDEFAEASVEYGYSPEFQAECYRIAAEAATMVTRWQLGQLRAGAR